MGQHIHRSQDQDVFGGAIVPPATPTQRCWASSHTAPSTPRSTQTPRQRDICSSCTASFPEHPCLQPTGGAPAGDTVDQVPPWEAHCPEVQPHAQPRMLGPTLLKRNTGLNTVCVGLHASAAVRGGRDFVLKAWICREALFGLQTGPCLLPNSKTKGQSGFTVTQGCPSEQELRHPPKSSASCSVSWEHGAGGTEGP